MSDGVPVTVSEAAQTGDRLVTLVALRNVLARSIDEAESDRDLAALAVRLTVVLGEIAALSGAPGESTTDDLSARRRERAQNRGERKVARS